MIHPARSYRFFFLFFRFCKHQHFVCFAHPPRSFSKMFHRFCHKFEAGIKRQIKRVVPGPCFMSIRLHFGEENLDFRWDDVVDECKRKKENIKKSITNEVFTRNATAESSSQWSAKFYCGLKVYATRLRLFHLVIIRKLKRSVWFQLEDRNSRQRSVLSSQRHPRRWNSSVSIAVTSLWNLTLRGFCLGESLRFSTFAHLSVSIKTLRNIVFNKLFLWALANSALTAVRCQTIGKCKAQTRLRD